MGGGGWARQAEDGEPAEVSSITPSSQSCWAKTWDRIEPGLGLPPLGQLPYLCPGQLGGVAVRGQASARGGPVHPHNLPHHLFAKKEDASF